MRAPISLPTHISPTRPFWLIDDSHPRGYGVVSHCGFDLHLPVDEWHWASFPSLCVVEPEAGLDSIVWSEVVLHWKMHRRLILPLGFPSSSDVRLAFWVLFHFHVWQRNWSPTSSVKLGHQPLTQSVGKWEGGAAGCRLRKQIMGVLSLALHHLYDFGLNESLPVSVLLCLPVTGLNNSNCLMGLLWRLDELLYESQHSVRVCNYCPQHSECQLQLATAHLAQVYPAQLPSLLQVL